MAMKKGGRSGAAITGMLLTFASPFRVVPERANRKDGDKTQAPWSNALRSAT